MGNETLISEIVGPKPYEQIARLKSDIDSLQAKYKEAMMELAKGLKFNPTNLKELHAKVNSYKANILDLSNVMKEINNMSFVYEKAMDRIIAANIKLIKSNKDLATSSKEVVTSETAITTTLSGSSNAFKDETAAIEGNTVAKREEVVITEELKAFIDKSLGSRAKNIAKLEEEQRMLKATRKAKREVDNEERKGLITYDEAIRRRRELTEAEIDHNAKVQQTTRILTNETRLVNSSTGSYFELYQQLERMRLAYNSLSKEMAASPLGVELQKKTEELSRQVNTAAKSVGNYRLQVGNYERSNQILLASLNQLTREAPAFAVSLSTGFLAISNNLPILADAIQRIRTENAQLRAEGQKTVPVWKQLLRGLGSWQTLLSVGITLLTVYGADMIKWTASLFGASEATKAANDTLTEYNATMLKERANMRELFETLNQTSEGTRARAEAIDEINDKYGDYLPNLLSERSSTDEIRKAYEAINRELLRNAALKAQQKKLDEVLTESGEKQSKALTKLREIAVKAYGEEVASDMLSRVIGLTETLVNEGYDADRIWNQIGTTLRATTDSANKLGGSFYDTLDKFVSSYKNANDQMEAIKNVIPLRISPKEGNEAVVRNKKYYEEQRKAAQSFIDRLDEDIVKSLKASKFEGIPKATVNKYIDSLKKIKEADEALKAYETDKNQGKAYKEAQQAIAEANISLLEEGYEKEKAIINANFDQKIADVKEKGVMVTEQLKLIEEQRNKELSELEERFAHDRAMENVKNRISAAKEGSLEEVDARIDMLMLQRDAELKAAKETGADKLLIEEKYAKMIQDVWDEWGKGELKRQQELDDEMLSQRQLDIKRQMTELTKSYGGNLKDREKYNKEMLRLQEDFALESLQIQIDTLRNNLDLLPYDERIKAEKELTKLLGQQEDIRLRQAQRKSDEDLEYQKKIEAAKKRLIQESIKAFISIGNSLFERQIQNVEAEIEANQEEYDAKVETIDALAEKDIITTEEAEARKRAAEEETSRKNKELEKKKAELQTRQAKFQKSIDIAQTIAATARAIMVAYKETGPIAGAIFAAMIAATGAVQLATIIAQPIPKYAHGTDNHPGGLAIVGDGGRSEAVLVGDKAYITPDKPTLLSLPAGAEVVPDLNDPAFLSRFVDNMYWITHNKKGEPVQIVNNFDAEGIIRANQRIEAAIYDLGRNIKRASDNAAFEDYKRRNMR